LNTEVSNDIKAQAVYGSNSKGTETTEEGDEFSLFSTGLTDRTTSWNDFKMGATNKCVPPEAGAEATAEGTARVDDPVGERKLLHDQYTDAWLDVVKGVDSNTVDALKAAAKNLQGYSKYKEVQASSPPILPLKFNFTIDGLTGFKWGHSLSIENGLATRYDGCSFMVTGIDHKISLDSWDTSISTVLRIKPSDKDLRLVLRTPKPIPVSHYNSTNNPGSYNSGMRG
jgi:hypothetical protein